jgi:hypothetical protein
MKQITTIILGLTMVLGIAACGGSSSDGRAFVKVAHISPDAPAVDVLVDGAVVLSFVSYLESSGYLEVSDGVRNFLVNAAGTETSVINADVELADGAYYSVFAVNLLGAIEPLVLVDDLTLPEPGFVKVRIVHAAPSAPTVDIYVTGVDDDISTLEPTLSSVPFKADSGYLSIPAGTYRVRVTIEGTKTVAIDTGALALEGGTISTAAAIDATGGGAPFGVLLISEERQNKSGPR